MKDNKKIYCFCHSCSHFSFYFGAGDREFGLDLINEFKLAKLNLAFLELDRT